MIRAEGGLVHCRHLPGLCAGPSVGRSSSLPEALDEVESRLITEALTEAAGNMSRASQALGISERIMGLRMKKFGLDFKSFRAGKKK